MFKRFTSLLVDLNNLLNKIPLLIDKNEIKLLREKSNIAKILFTDDYISIKTFFQFH